jgi:hypothetical protein
MLTTKRIAPANGWQSGRHDLSVKQCEEQLFMKVDGHFIFNAVLILIHQIHSHQKTACHAMVIGAG